ncbi:MAG: hypothetical protein RL154_1340 [Pseudomonadota bacterium]|jgi:phosphate transport system protein
MMPNFELRVSQIRKDIISMAQISLASFRESLNALKNQSVEGFKIARDNNVQHLVYLSDSVDNSIVVALALYSPEAGELRSLIASLKITNELVRIGESAQKYAKGMELSMQQGYDLVPVLPLAIKLNEITVDCLTHTASCLENFSMDSYRGVQIEEEKSDEVFSLFQKELASIMPNTETALEYLRLMRAMKRHERVTDHCQNIAHLLYYAEQGGKLTSK